MMETTASKALRPDTRGLITIDEARKAAEAHKRAMPVQRLLGGGMDHGDVLELFGLVDRGTPWTDAAAELGRRDLVRAEQALAGGHELTARSWFFFAAACFRAAQSALPADDPGKPVLYRALIDAFAAGGQLAAPPYEHVTVPHAGHAMAGWLIRPPATPRGTVLVLGGFDGWREEYHAGATHLVDRGLAVLLLDGPGQGETRLFGGHAFQDDMTAPLRAAVDWVLGRDDLPGAVGVWGNSMGGYLAGLLASGDDRVRACCVNGGTDRPAEVLDRFPRFVAKVQALYGGVDPDEACRRIELQRLPAARLADLRCPLLVLHGTPDQVFLVESAHRLLAAAGAEDKTLAEWPDGDHCIYNHSHEKHVLIADWFDERLTGS